MSVDTTVVVSVGDDHIRPLIFTAETIKKFWDNSKQFPTIYGHEIVDDWGKFIDLFFHNNNGELSPKGLFWVLNDFTGVFYLTNIVLDGEQLIDANAHYTFYDRRHHGRVPLVKEMLKFWFNKYQFIRLSAEIPNYATPQARHFAQECGMSYEGKKRNAALYKDQWYAVNLYGILKQEVLGR